MHCHAVDWLPCSVNLIGNTCRLIGVMLLHLERMRNLGWNQRWRQVARDVFATNPKITNAPLADQDIFNAVLARHPEYVL